MQRKRPLTRRTRLQPGEKPLAKVNPDRQRKRRQRQRTKHAAYRASETYRVVEARAGGRCEYVATLWADSPVAYAWRCPNTATLQHHHLTYARYGGRELPEDVVVLCRAHHELIEMTQHPTRRRG